MKKIFLVNFKKVFQKNNISKMGGSKYDNDLLEIFKELNFKIEYYPVVGSQKIKCLSLIKLVIRLLTSKDILYFFRYPFLYSANSKHKNIGIIYQYILFKMMKISKNKIGVFVSDLEYLRYGGLNSIKIDVNLLKNFDYIIVHNNIMKNFLIENGLFSSNLISQEIGNNLSNEFEIPKRILSDTIVFSGNLSKSKFLSKFNNENIVSYKINLYGIGFNATDENKILKYKGSYSSEDIVKVLDGSFGLVWDGPSINRCTGPFCEFDYLKIINPSKFSQYIVAGLPVIAWKEAAVAKIIKKYNIGFVVDNLIEIDDILNNIDEKTYQDYLYNVMRLRRKVMTGYHFKLAIRDIKEI